MVNSVLIDRSAEDPSARPAREEAWEMALGGLSDRQRAAVALHYRHGLSQKEIGNVFGLHESRICQILKETIGLLRNSGRYKLLASN